MTVAGAARHTWLQLGFGLGHAFLQAWHDWRAAPRSATRLDFIAITPAPPDAAALGHAHAGTKLQALAEALAAQWPPPARNLHRLAFDAGKVHLLLAVGEASEVLAELDARVDDFRIDELRLPDDARRDGLRLCKALARLAAPEAQLLAAPTLHALAPALRSAGFALEATAGAIHARYRPSFTPRQRQPARPQATETHALIVGAGLAGCALAAALAEQGWRSTLIDAAAACATQASGNPAGLFHGSVHPQDGIHARFNRAAALSAQRTVQQALDAGLARGSAQGLLRLESRGKTAAQMQAELSSLRLPAGYVQALDAAQASALCGLPLAHPALFFPGGGWVQPAALARACLHRAGAAVQFRGGARVGALRRAGTQWQLLDDAGGLIAAAQTVVLANACDALRLLSAPHWPVRAVRGQISLCPSALLRLPRMPVAGDGYVLPAVDGLAVFGASSQEGDTDTSVRDADHAFNLQRLARLGVQPLPSPAQLRGRVGWRCVAQDRLPLVGAVPDEAAAAALRLERLGAVPRHHGLYLLAALGSRGITWCELAAQLLAAQITAAPLPLEAALVAALDPARFVLRARRAPRSGR